MTIEPFDDSLIGSYFKIDMDEPTSDGVVFKIESVDLNQKEVYTTPSMLWDKWYLEDRATMFTREDNPEYFL